MILKTKLELVNNATHSKINLQAEEWPSKAKILGLSDEHTTRFFHKMHLFKEAILLYQSPLECKNFVKLKETQSFSLICQVNEAFCCTKGLYEMKN